VLLTRALLAALLLSGCVFDATGLDVPDGPGTSGDGVSDQLQRRDGPLADLADAASTDTDGPLEPDSKPKPDAKPTPDTSVPPDTVPACLTWSIAPSHFDPCKSKTPGPYLGLSVAGTYTYDTTSGALKAPSGSAIATVSEVVTQTGGPSARLWSVNGLKLGASSTLRVTGTHPLIVASWAAVTVNGTIDVSSRRTKGVTGAGANPSSCSTHAPTAGGLHSGEGGGGGGGGFGSDGGDGGKGDGGNAAAGTRGTKVAAPAFVRGGCKGAAGGGGSGLGGDGGGALQLTARTGITVNGTLHAGGAGGKAATGYEDGGGGAGSGGMIGLEAGTITLGSGAVLAANGGGGGEGLNGGTGKNGEDGKAFSAAAKGGAGGSSYGGDGGDGGHGVSVSGKPGKTE
jgi:hypothetical protein